MYIGNHNNMIGSSEYKDSLFGTLFVDRGKANADIDRCSMQIVQRVLEHRDMNDCRQTQNNYGLQGIVELHKQMRTFGLNLPFIYLRHATKTANDYSWGGRVEKLDCWRCEVENKRFNKSAVVVMSNT